MEQKTIAFLVEGKTKITGGALESEGHRLRLRQVFHPKRKLKNPVLLFGKEDEKPKKIKLKETVWKSGRSGFTGRAGGVFVNITRFKSDELAYGLDVSCEAVEAVEVEAPKGWI